MLCGGHVNRAHTKQLKEMVNVKAFSAGFKSRYRRRFPSVDTVKCVCFGKHHSAGCSCLGAGFLLQARINFFCVLLHAGNSDDKFHHGALDDALKAVSSFEGKVGSLYQVHTYQQTLRGQSSRRYDQSALKLCRLLADAHQPTFWCTLTTLQDVQYW